METKDACEPPPLPLKALEGDPVFENEYLFGFDDILVFSEEMLLKSHFNG